MVPGESGPVISVLEEQRQDGDTATVQPRPTVVQTARVIKPKPVTPAMKVKTVSSPCEDSLWHKSAGAGKSRKNNPQIYCRQIIAISERKC